MSTPICPSVEDILFAADAGLAARQARVPREPGYPSDVRLLMDVLPEWTVVDATHQYGRRLLMRHREQSWLLLVFATRARSLRLLPAREHRTLDRFSFAVTPTEGTGWVTGTEDEVIDDVVKRHRAGRWSTDALLWILKVLPGERAEAERAMLGFWVGRKRVH